MSVGVLLAAAGAAFLATLAGLILMRPLLRRYALAHPTARSSHVIPTPQGGGLAVMPSTLVVAVTAIAVSGGRPAAVLATALGAGALMVLGAVDDVRGLPPAVRLAVQSAIVLTVLAALPEPATLAPHMDVWLARAVLAVGIVWFINLFNFMDGLDWMTVGFTLPVTTAICVIGLLRPFPAEATILAAALAGATLGFAPFNRPVASVFLGDAGSLPMGFTIASLLVLLASSGYPAAALLLPLYYVADTGLTLLRRAWQRDRIWEAHRTHFYQLATSRGLSVQHIVGRVFVVNCALAALAVCTVLQASFRWDVVCVAGGVGLVARLLVGFRGGTT